MKIDEAIEGLTYRFQNPSDLDTGDFRTALKLGIEALKRVQLQHNPDGVSTERLLPGETKE